jgi:hypothetical protein
METPRTTTRPGFTVDFSVNIPTLILLSTTFVSLTAGWVHLTDSQREISDSLTAQAQATAAMQQHIEKCDRTLTVLNERLKAYPLHRHVGSKIVYDAEPLVDQDYQTEYGEARQGEK